MYLYPADKLFEIDRQRWLKFCFFLPFTYNMLYFQAPRFVFLAHNLK